MRIVLKKIAGMLMVTVAVFSSMALQAAEPEEIDCPVCDIVANDVMSALQNACDTPVTVANINSIKTNSPIYALMVTIKNTSPDAYAVFHKSAISTLRCYDLDSWADRAMQDFKVAVKVKNPK